MPIIGGMGLGAKRLATWIARSTLSQREVADLIGTDETTLSHILNGRRRPTLDQAVSISHATGIPEEAWVSTAVAAASVGSARTAAKSRVDK